MDTDLKRELQREREFLEHLRKFVPEKEFCNIVFNAGHLNNIPFYVVFTWTLVPIQISYRGLLLAHNTNQSVTQTKNFSQFWPAQFY